MRLRMVMDEKEKYWTSGPKINGKYPVPVVILELREKWQLSGMGPECQNDILRYQRWICVGIHINKDHANEGTIVVACRTTDQVVSPAWFFSNNVIGSECLRPCMELQGKIIACNTYHSFIYTCIFDLFNLHLVMILANLDFFPLWN